MEFFTSATDPMGELFADPALRDAYLDAVCADYERRTASDDESLGEPDAAPPIFDDPSAEERRESFEAFLDLGGLARRQRALVAEQDAAICRLLARAEADTVPWLGPDPTDDPGWVDPRGRTHAAVREHRRQLAVRAAAADIATRLHLSENTVRSRAHRAQVLADRCPLIWRRCLAGEVSEQNATTAATIADTLPADPPTWRAFDESLTGQAGSLAPGRFRTRARAVRERVHPESLTDRRARAMKDRYVWVRPDLDGMATLTALLPAEHAHAIDNHLETTARHLAAQPDEQRTLAQLRADAFCDLMASADPAHADDTAHTDTATPTGGVAPANTVVHGITATVNLTIPALALLGHSDEPATLDGYGPIDLDTARELAGTATSFVRVLTHPVTGTILDIDRKTYRVPADLKRWLRVRHPTCVFPGCQKPSSHCDIDHRKRWTDGGTTSAENTAPICERHHTLKDETQWGMHADPTTGEITWTSPTGNEIPNDPPPF